MKQLVLYSRYVDWCRGKQEPRTFEDWKREVLPWWWIEGRLSGNGE